MLVLVRARLGPKIAAALAFVVYDSISHGEKSPSAVVPRDSGACINNRLNGEMIAIVQQTRDTLHLFA